MSTLPAATPRDTTPGRVLRRAAAALREELAVQKVPAWLAANQANLWDTIAAEADKHDVLMDVTTCWQRTFNATVCQQQYRAARDYLAVVQQPATHLDTLRQAVIDEGGDWTTHRAASFIPVTPERARQMLNQLAKEKLLIKHGKRGRLWTPFYNVAVIGGKVHEPAGDGRLLPACSPNVKAGDTRSFRSTRQLVTCTVCLRHRKLMRTQQWTAPDRL
ncbi:hypothetical protein ACQEVF_56675 [Nonomuraea polychroma]|uniref:hypothetical protein n=1 Tax=Nonomuraea polychroma TaxID=46176 RepID=UPI003D9264FA